MDSNSDLSIDSERNRASWVQLANQIDGAPDHPAFNRLKAAISPIVHRAMNAQFDSLFKAEAYFNHVRLFSPGDRNTRVTLELRSPADPHLYISLCDWDIQYESPSQCCRVKPEEGFPVFTRYLAASVAGDNVGPDP